MEDTEHGSEDRMRIDPTGWTWKTAVVFCVIMLSTSFVIGALREVSFFRDGWNFPELYLPMIWLLGAVIACRVWQGQRRAEIQPKLASTVLIGVAAIVEAAMISYDWLVLRRS